MPSPRVFATIFLAVLALRLSDVEADELAAAYQVENNWADVPAGRTLAAMSAIGVDSRGHVWTVDRCEESGCAASKLAPIFEFDTKGKLVKNFGAGLFAAPHGMFIDRQDNIWIADFRAAGGKGLQVFKFNRNGKLLMTLGQAGVAGTEHNLLSAPSDMAVASNGDIFVVDGHGKDTNERIIKFDRHGHFVKAWGKPGNGPGEFNTPHTIVLDSQGRVLIGDRGNQRVQIFDSEGNFLTEWKQFGAPSGLAIDQRDTLYISGSDPNSPNRQGIWIANAKTGAALSFIPGDPAADGKGLSAPEDIAIDKDGHIFGPNVVAHNIKRYSKQ